MPQGDNNSGALFPNDKGDNPARPDYRGRAQINGKPYRISGWRRRTRASGQPMLSLAFTEDDFPEDPTENRQEPLDDRPGF